MKFTLAIAFALLMATAYGFRVKEASTTEATNTTEIKDTTEQDTCQSSEWSTDYGVVCNGLSEWCDMADGKHNNTYTDKCEDGRYYKSECDDVYNNTSSKFECESKDCQDGEDTNCSLCKEEYTSDYNEEHSNSTSHMNSYCENADGTQWTYTSNCTNSYDEETYTSAGACQSFDTSSDMDGNFTSNDCSSFYDSQSSSDYCVHEDESWSSTLYYNTDNGWGSTTCQGNSTAEECEQCTTDENWEETCYGTGSEKDTLSNSTTIDTR